MFFLLFALGACVGSFLNVCIWRLPRGESVVEPPSHCPSCNTRLQPIDLIPLVSQAALGSRCRYCKSKISWRYFGMEVLTGVLFALAGTRVIALQTAKNISWMDNPVPLLQILLVVSCLIVIFWVDYDTFTIPISAALLMGLTGVAADAWGVWKGTGALSLAPLFPGLDLLSAPLPTSVLGMLVVAAFFWTVRAVGSLLLKKEAMGFGDVFLVAAIGANIGWSGLLLLFFFLSVTVGALTGILMKTPRGIRAYRWAKRRMARYVSTQKALPGRLLRHAFRKQVPFGPMLAVGAYITLLYGEPLAQWYLGWVNGF
jgi:leader peptidase (prepilin peptidase) / N-methyltransferase